MAVQQWVRGGSTTVGADGTIKCGEAMRPDSKVIADARLEVKRMLRKRMPERWQHTRGVANQAAKIAFTVPPADRVILISAAWLHDIGYTPALRKTGFHPLDGALFLRERGWNERTVALVAHHSGARFVPAYRGFESLMAEFDFEDSAVSDALTYADQTVGPHGRKMTVPYRIAEAISRHGPDSPNARARVDRVPYLLAVADRVEQRLAASRPTRHR